MAELRNLRDGTVRWRGEDPAECLAAMGELGDAAREYMVVGFDSSDFTTKAGNAIKLASSADLIEEPPPLRLELVNAATGEVEQTYEPADGESAAKTRKRAEAAADELNAQARQDGIAHLGETVSFTVRSPLEV